MGCVQEMTSPFDKIPFWLSTWSRRRLHFEQFPSRTLHRNINLKSTKELEPGGVTTSWRETTFSAEFSKWQNGPAEQETAQLLWNKPCLHASEDYTPRIISSSTQALVEESAAFTSVTEFSAWKLSVVLSAPGAARCHDACWQRVGKTPQGMSEVCSVTPTGRYWLTAGSRISCHCFVKAVLLERNWTRNEADVCFLISNSFSFPFHKYCSRAQVWRNKYALPFPKGASE